MTETNNGSDNSWREKAVSFAAGLAGVLALSGCATSAAQEGPIVRVNVQFRPDSYNPGGFVKVYPGVTDSEKDQVSSDAFPPLLVVDGVCRAIGRNIVGAPSIDGADRSSAVWVRIGWSQFTDQYVPAANINANSADLAKLPIC